MNFKSLVKEAFAPSITSEYVKIASLSPQAEMEGEIKIAHILESLLEGQEITQDEYDYLLALSTDRELKKEAGRSMLQGSKNFLWGQSDSDSRMRNTVLTTLGIGLTAAQFAPAISNLVSKGIDPIREQMRFRRMMALPGNDMIQDAVVNNAAAAYYIPEQEGESDEARAAKAVRRGFSLLHKMAPDITSTPEIARGIMENQIIGGNPVEIMRTAFQDQKNFDDSYGRQLQMLRNQQDLIPAPQIVTGLARDIDALNGPRNIPLEQMSDAMYAKAVARNAGMTAGQERAKFNVGKAYDGIDPKHVARAQEIAEKEVRMQANVDATVREQHARKNSGHVSQREGITAHSKAMQTERAKEHHRENLANKHGFPYIPTGKP